MHRKEKVPSRKKSKAEIATHFHRIPELRFEDQQLTWFAGLVLLQAPIARLDLRRRFRDRDFYQDGPMVQRALGLKSLPDVATISRLLRDADAESVEHVRALARDLACGSGALRPR